MEVPGNPGGADRLEMLEWARQKKERAASEREKRITRRQDLLERRLGSHSDAPDLYVDRPLWSERMLQILSPSLQGKGGGAVDDFDLDLDYNHDDRRGRAQSAPVGDAASASVPSTGLSLPGSRGDRAPPLPPPHEATGATAKAHHGALLAAEPGAGADAAKEEEEEEEAPPTAHQAALNLTIKGKAIVAQTIGNVCSGNATFAQAEQLGWSTQIAKTVTTLLTRSFPGHKFIVHATLVPNKRVGLHVRASCLWDKDSDASVFVHRVEGGVRTVGISTRKARQR